MQRLLLVENEPEKLRAMERVTAGDQREIVTATEPARAIDILGSSPVDVVVTDLALISPGKDTEGFNVLRTAAGKDIPVIVVSAYLSYDRMRQAMDLGAFDVIDRGSNAYEFRDMLRYKVNLALRFAGALRLGRPANEPATT